ncbi:MAG: ATP-grasp domain-containing protein [Bacillota bacterium]
MKILILEYFISRGGLLNQKISFYSEGIKMLNTLLHSFSDIEDAEVTTYINSDFFHFFPGRYRNKNIEFKKAEIHRGVDYLSYLEKNISDEYDFFILTAPESDNILFKLSRLLEKKGIINLGSSSDTVKLTGNKWTVYNSLKNTIIKQPPTVLIDKLKQKNKFEEQIENITFPALAKAVYSAGSELEIIETKQDLDKLDGQKDHLLQKQLPGIPGSISVLACENDFKILSVNKQIIDEKNYKYLGGIIDYPFPDQDKLKKITAEIKKTFPTLKGYFGIDFIYSDGDYYLLEVNPRITSSIIGLNQKISLGQCIIDSVLHNRLPDYISFDSQHKFNIY